MKLSFPVVLKKSSPCGYAKSVEIPDLLPHPHVFTFEQFGIIEADGYESFLRRAITLTLRKREEENKSIPHPNRIDSVLERFLQRKTKPGKFDERLEIFVDYTPLYGCHFFEKIMRPLTQVTIIAEIASGTILTIGTLQLTQGGLIPMSPQTEEATDITQAILSALLDLWIAFSGPGIAFMSEFGVAIDDLLTRVWRKLTCDAYATEDSVEQNSSRCTETKIKLMQGIFALLVLNNVWTGATQDYEQTLLLNQQLESTEGFPAWLISAANWTSYGFNQLNDPVEILSLMILGFKLIRAWLSAPLPADQPVTEAKTEAVNIASETDVITIASDYKAIPVQSVQTTLTCPLLSEMEEEAKAAAGRAHRRSGVFTPAPPQALVVSSPMPIATGYGPGHRY